MPNVFKYNPTSTEVQSLRVGDIYIGVGDVAKGPTTLTGFKNGPNLGTSSTAIIMNRDTGTFSWYINFTDQELISRTNRIDPTGINLITNNPTPTTNTTGYAVVGGVGTLTFDAGESAIRWLRTSYESWGAYVWNNSIQNYVFDKFSNYTATFEWKFGPSHSANESYNFEIINGPGTYIVLRVGLTASSTLQESGWYRFTRVSKPLQDGVGQTIQYRIIRGSTVGITDIYWRNLEYYKTTRTTKEECSSYFAGQSDKMLLNKDYESIVTDGLVLNFDAGFLPSYPGTGSSWYDLGPSQSNGTLQNGPTFDSGGWINFDGSNDFVQLTNTITLTSEFTLNLFILPTSTSTKVLLGNDGSDYLQINNSAALGLFSSTESITLNGYSWDTSKPSMVTVTRDTSNNIQTYRNSVSSVSGTLTGNFRIKQIGQRGDLSRFYMGNIYKTQVYNRSLTQQEILQNYYGGPIITDGLTFSIDASSFISYDRIGATWSNMVGTTVNGTLTNSPTFNLLYGGGFKFDGTNQFVTYGNHTPYGFTSGIFSVCVWLMIPSTWTGGSQYPNLISKGASAGWDTNGWAVFAFRNHGSGNGFTLGYGMRNSTTVNNGAQIGNIPTDRPVHFCVTLDGSNIRAYLDGTVRTTISQTITPASNTDSFIIARGPSTGYFPGTVYMSQIYTRSLSPSEVLQNFNAHKSRYVF